MEFTKAKSVAAAIGATLTALTTALATAQAVLDDGALDAAEYGFITTAIVTLCGTVYAVWRVKNKVIPATNGVTARPGPAPR